MSYRIFISWMFISNYCSDNLLALWINKECVQPRRLYTSIKIQPIGKLSPFGGFARKNKFCEIRQSFFFSLFFFIAQKRKVCFANYSKTVLNLRTRRNKEGQVCNTYYREHSVSNVQGVGKIHTGLQNDFAKSKNPQAACMTVLSKLLIKALFGYVTVIRGTELPLHYKPCTNSPTLPEPLHL